MDEAEYDAAAAACDAVIHAGALVNHVKPYMAHSRANVTGTHDVLEFAAAKGRNRVVHFVSTSVVALSTITQDEPQALEDAPLRASVNVLDWNGYCQSKFVSERLCRDAASFGLPVVVYRSFVHPILD